MQIKPPIGLMPRRIWEELHPSPDHRKLKIRYHQLKAAMHRFFDAGIPIPIAWKEEAKDIFEIMGEDVF